MKNEDIDFDPALSALLAEAAPRRRLPSGLKARIMREAGQDVSPRCGQYTHRYGSRRDVPSRLVLAAAAIALMLLPVLVPRDSGLSLTVVKGQAALSGRSVSVSQEGEALLAIRGRAVVRLSQGAQAEVLLAGRTIELLLGRGWALSAVKTGTPYRVSTPFGAAEALGTEFIVKGEEARAYVCICHGRLRLSGDFPATEIAAERHYDVFLSSAGPPTPAGKEGSLAGHTDEERSSLPKP